MGITFLLTDTVGSAVCDVATTKAFKGIHLSPNVAAELDAMDKTLLVNNTKDTSRKTPVFLQVLTDKNSKVDFSAPWGTQAKSSVNSNLDIATVYYTMLYFSKTGVVDTQKLTTLINYTLHYN
jgi:major type 1 subunit fimbrin (pilin)